jgi:hypothetical protein
MNLPGDYVEILKAEYPRRLGDNGWIHVRTLIPRALSAGATWERILAGTRAYKRHCDTTGKTGTELVKQARTFYGPAQYWDEWADMPAPVTKESQEWERLKARNRTVWSFGIDMSDFREPRPGETPDDYRKAQDAEHARRVEAKRVPLRSVS